MKIIKKIKKIFNKDHPIDILNQRYSNVLDRIEYKHANFERLTNFDIDTFMELYRSGIIYIKTDAAYSLESLKLAIDRCGLNTTIDAGQSIIYYDPDLADRLKNIDMETEDDDNEK